MTPTLRIARTRYSPLVWVGLLSAMIAAPTLALWQDKKDAPPAQTDKKTTDQKKPDIDVKKSDSKGQDENSQNNQRGRRGRRGAGGGLGDQKSDTTRSAPANKSDGLKVVPTGQGSDATKGAIRVQTGPDGKPQIIGPDGKPITPGSGGNAVINGPGGDPGRGPGNGGFGPGGFGGGQFGGGGGGFPTFSPGGLISMDYRGADINNVLKFFSMATGWQIVPDPTLTGSVTIISPKQLTIDQAFQVLQSVLQIRGYTGQLETHGKTQVLKIVTLDRAAGGPTVIVGEAKDANGNPLPGVTSPKKTADELKGQVITQVIPIENVDASALSRELTPLASKGASLVASAGTNALIVTDVAANVERIRTLVEMLDKAASNNQIEMIQLHHSDATDISNAINGLFRQVFGRGRGAGGFNGGQGGGNQAFGGGLPPGVTLPGGGQPGGQPGGAPGADPARAAVVAVPDTRTNSVLVVASKENLERVKELVAKLDSAETAAMDTYVRKLKYANALDVSDTINNILSNGSVAGRGAGGGGASFAQRVFGGGGFGGGFGGGGFGGGGGQSGNVQSTDPFAKVVGDARTNSLYIIATKEKMERIDELIRELDVEVPVETTTFVVPLKNAQAQDMATSLSQAFGTQTGGGNNNFGGFGGFNIFGNNNNRNNGGRQQPINRRQGTGNNGGGFGGRSISMPPTQTLFQNADPSGQIRGTWTPNGFVPDQQPLTDETTRAAGGGAGQFFGGGFRGGGGGFGGGFGGGQLNTPMYGRGQAGGVVNLLQLRQNVGVVPDLGSNSLIITTTPDNMRAIQQIIDSLDIVPRQVMIEVIIAEASLDSTQKLGIQFDGKGIGKFLGTATNNNGSSNFPLGNGGTTAGNVATPLVPGAQFGISAVNGNFNALVQALATDNRVHILSTPKIFTSNNMEAQINITTNIPIVQASPAFGFGGTTTSYTYLPVGITVDVTPRITKDGLVTMDIQASDTELLGFDTLQTGTDTNGRPTFVSAPRYSDRTTDTSVSARDGEVIVLGGLMRDNKTIDTQKVPLLGDIPILGALFRSRTTTKSKTELMVFMVPHVVDGDAQNRKMVQDQAKQIMKDVPELIKQYPQLDPKSQRPLPNSPDGGAPKPEDNKRPDTQTKPQGPRKPDTEAKPESNNGP